MNRLGKNDTQNFEIQTQFEDLNIHEKKLSSLQFSIWNTDSQVGHSKFVGDVVETAQYLEHHDLSWLEVSALDLEYMYSLQPISAVQWLIWYYETALEKLEENNFDYRVRVSYPTA